ncbi:MAG: response regulator [Proteobacteria bacterium]|nr:response regulator [Pseudomonadota bacterium]
MATMILCLACVTASGVQASPQVVEGLIDLTDRDFQRDGKVYLDGEWEFFWGRHLTASDFLTLRVDEAGHINVPGSWNGYPFEGEPVSGEGIATYRLTILTSAAEPLALQIPDIGTSYRLIVNAKEAIVVGRPGVSRDSSTPRYKPTIVPLPTARRIELIFQVSNFHHRLGGIWLPILIGESHQIAMLREFRVGRDLLLFGAIMMLGLYNLVLFAMRRGDPSTFFLGVFCSLLATRTLMVGERFMTEMANLPFAWFIRIEYVTWFLAVVTFGGFLRTMFPREFNRYAAYSVYSVFGLACLVVLLLPPYISTKIVMPMQVCTVAALLYGTWALGVACVRKREGALILIFAYLVLFFTAISDAGVIANVLLLDVGLVIFTFSQSALISWRFTRSFKTIERQSSQLRAANVRLQTQEKLRREAELESQTLQNRIIQSEKMEAIGLLAGGIAHDLNNMLANTVTYPEIAMLDLKEDDPLYTPLKMTKEAGLKAAAVIQDLLTLTRRGLVQREVLNLNELVRDYLDSAEHKAMLNPGNPVDISVDLEEDLHNIEGSAPHLQKILMNLIANSIEAQQNGGVIQITTMNESTMSRSVFHGDLKEGDYVVLSVEDNGPGIPHEDLDKVFLPFHTTKQMGQSGTGLGMPIVLGVVQDHGGAVDVVAMEGMGTRFDIYLPRTRKPVTRKPEAIPLARLKGDGEHILIVDDQADQRALACSALEHLNYVVTTCARGEEAVKLARENHYSLIMLDMVMDDGWDGLQTFMSLQKSDPNQKVVVVTGYADVERAREAAELGVHVFVKKPFTLEEIGRAIRSALTR